MLTFAETVFCTGVISDAMVDMTGGSGVNIKFTELRVNEMIADGSLLERFSDTFPHY